VDVDVDVEDGSGLIVSSESLSVKLFTFAIVTMVISRIGRGQGALSVAAHVTLGIEIFTIVIPTNLANIPSLGAGLTSNGNLI
jgi:hypothetical protein